MKAGVIVAPDAQGERHVHEQKSRRGIGGTSGMDGPSRMCASARRQSDRGLESDGQGRKGQGGRADANAGDVKDEASLEPSSAVSAAFDISPNRGEWGEVWVAEAESGRWTSRCGDAYGALLGRGWRQ